MTERTKNNSPSDDNFNEVLGNYYAFVNSSNDAQTNDRFQSIEISTQNFHMQTHSTKLHFPGSIRNLSNSLLTEMLKTNLNQTNKLLELTSNVINDNQERYYSTKKPYESPLNDYILSSPPIGFKLIGIQHLARHGSRTLNGHNYDLVILKLWSIAKKQNLLTELGEQLLEDTTMFIDANNHIGRGELSQLGKQEQYGIGQRLYNRAKQLLDSSSVISVMTSGKKRAIDSAEEFLNGLTSMQPNIKIINEYPNKRLLYFHKSCEKYQEFKATNLNIKAKLISVKNLDKTKIYARQVLSRIYKNEFVESLINGNDRISINNENIDPIVDGCVNNEVNIVICLYEMFSVSPAHAQPHISKMLEKYFTPEESNWFAYVHDAEEFYIKGPSIEGTTETFHMAKPLLEHFFSSVNSRILSENNVVAHFRFAHAETIIPFATLLQIPRLSDQAVDLCDIYTYENNHWRGDQIAPMAANIQWEIYQHQLNSNHILIRMLYNEIEVRFKEDCQPITPDSYFYEYHELKRSYAHLL